MSDRVALIGFPLDGNSSFLQGAAEAPAVIRQELYSDCGNLWTESGIDLFDKFDDVGDLLIESDKDFANAVETATRCVLEKSQKFIALGGDHSITFPVVKALAQRVSDLNILHIDAHPDLYENFEDNPYSHASPFARVSENKLVSRLVQIGIRTFNKHQREQAARYHVESHEMKDWRDDVVLQFDAPLYLSIDMDALDPAFAPGVSHPEPGGFSTRQVIQIIQKVKAPYVVGADIVEFNPMKDLSGITGRAASKLLKELAARMLAAE